MSVLDKFRLDGKIAIVTGAGRGLGKAMAIGLAEAGADVAVTARSTHQIEETAEEIRKLGRRSLALTVDMMETAQLDSAVEQTVKTFGHVDILVNNAGIAVVKPLVPLPGFKEGINRDDLMRVFETNLIGPFFLTQAVGKYFMQQGKGKVINITSVDASRNGSHKTTYASSKAGIIQFTRSLANEWARYRINVNAIAPGYMLTEMTRPLAEDMGRNREILGRIPAGRWGEPADLMGAAVFLAAEASAYVNGFTLAVDGGWLAR